MENSNFRVCVVGLGYVGLPLALALSEHFEVTGFDIDQNKINLYREGIDPTTENNEKMLASSIEYSTNPAIIKENNFIITCVPTPIGKTKKPDLKLVESASKLIGENLSQGSIVVYESTVYPGVTEEFCVPILEKYSNLKPGVDFKVGYSPERINPGDKDKTIEKITKVVSGMDEESLERIDYVYSKITKTHKTPSIKVAESAKVIENIQRDLNIALMNELNIIFDKLNIDTKSVLEAAGTKWNFHKYHPGLVGGHCIGVDPYYLTYKAQEIGYYPEVILAGRKINDNMHKFYAKKILKRLIEKNVKIKGAKVLILGLTFKPNVKDHRNSRVKNLIEELKFYGIEITGCDPLLDKNIINDNFKVENCDINNLKDDSDLIVLAVKHEILNNYHFDKEKLFVID